LRHLQDEIEGIAGTSQGITIACFMSGQLKRFLRRSTFFVELAQSERALVRALRFDMKRVKWSLYRSQQIENHLTFYTRRKLQLGSGDNFLKGWLNTDLHPRSRDYMYMDATKPFPFEDSIFDYIFSEHLIEHFTYEVGDSMLRECYRVLKLGGTIRISTPSLEQLTGLFRPRKSRSQDQFIRWVVDKYFPEIAVYKESFVINNSYSRWGHLFIYDYETLKGLLEKVGFIAIRRSSPGESEDENLRGIDLHGTVVGDFINRFETMVLEATK
jgi:predicted SAM-dependent methyltransferase